MRAVEQLQAAFAKGDLAGVCNRLSRDAKIQMGRTPHRDPGLCSRDLRTFHQWMRAARPGTVVAAPRLGEADIDGDEATVAALYADDAEGELRLRREDGRWKLDNFYGTVGPPPIDIRGAPERP